MYGMDIQIGWLFASPNLGARAHACTHARTHTCTRARISFFVRRQTLLHPATIMGLCGDKKEAAPAADMDVEKTEGEAKEAPANLVRTSPSPPRTMRPCQLLPGSGLLPFHTQF